jgi:hypothetical protein
MPRCPSTTQDTIVAGLTGAGLRVDGDEKLDTDCVKTGPPSAEDSSDNPNGDSRSRPSRCWITTTT